MVISKISFQLFIISSIPLAKDPNTIAILSFFQF